MKTFKFYFARYQATKTGYDERKDRYGLFVTIDREVEVTQAHLTIPPLALISGIGGTIGVGKEMLWIITTLVTFLITFYSKVTNSNRRPNRAWS